VPCADLPRLAEKLGIRISDVDVRAKVDVHGFFGLDEGVRPGFGEVSIDVHISGPEEPERYEKLRQTVHDHSPVLDVFMNPVPVKTSICVR
jgi:putative redox protein